MLKKFHRYGAILRTTALLCTTGVCLLATHSCNRTSEPTKKQTQEKDATVAYNKTVAINHNKTNATICKKHTA